MIKRMLQGVYENANLYHVRMAFSQDMDEMGRFGVGKLFHSLSIIARTIYLRLRHNIRVLYYPPSGPNRLPMLRDIALLLCVRWMFKKTIFHFHAAGLSELYPQLRWYTRYLFRLAYFEPDIAIQLSTHNPADATMIQAKATYVIPYGIEDDYLMMQCPNKPHNAICNILFVGMVSESKGVLVLIDAIRILRDSGVDVRVNVVGKFASERFRQLTLRRVGEFQLEDVFRFSGVLTGRAKHDQYLAADIFCFPTFYECESLPLVAIEAMQFRVPVILSRWRGLPSLINDGVEGFLVPDRDSVTLADKIALLVANPALRRRMGMKGRERYLQQYNTKIFYQRMDECFGNT